MSNLGDIIKSLKDENEEITEYAISLRDKGIKLESKIQELEELLKEACERLEEVLDYEWCANKIEDLLDKPEIIKLMEKV